MATDHNFKVKNGLNVEGAGVTIVGDGSDSRITSAGEIRFRPEGSSSNKVRITLNELEVQGSIDATQNLKTNNTTRINSAGTFTLANGTMTGPVTIAPSSGNTILNLNGAGASFVEKDTGTELYLANNSADRDIHLRINDGGSYLTALRIDAAEGGNVYLASDLILNSSKKVIFGGNDTYNAHLEYTDNTSGDHFLSIKTEHNNTITERAKFHAGTGRIDFSGNTYINAQHLSVEHANPTITLKDTSDDDDHHIQFLDNGGTQLADINFMHVADDFNIGTTTSRELNLYTNNSTALTVATNQNVTLANDLVVNGGDITINNQATSFKGLTINGTTPSVYFNDSEGSNAWHVGHNGGILYVLQDTNANGSYNTITAYWDSSDNYVVDNGYIRADDGYYVGTTQIVQNDRDIGNIPKNYLSNNFTGTYVNASGNYFNIQTGTGYTRIGSNNTTYSHFYTDRNQYYFNKSISVDTGTITSHNEDLVLQRVGSTKFNVGSTVTTATNDLRVLGSVQSSFSDTKVREYQIATGDAGGHFLLGKVRHNSSVDGAVEGVVRFAHDYGSSTNNCAIHFHFATRSNAHRGTWWYEHDDQEASGDRVHVRLIRDTGGDTYVWVTATDFAKATITATWRQCGSVTDSGSLTAGTLTTGTTEFDTANNPTSELHTGRLYPHGGAETVSSAIDAQGGSGSGYIQRFYNSTPTLVGGVGTINDEIWFGKGSAGLIFNDSQSAIYPWHVSNNAGSSGAIDLGIDSRRWKDIHLGGLIYLDGSAVTNSNNEWTNPVDNTSARSSFGRIEVYSNTYNSTSDIKLTDQGVIRSGNNMFLAAGGNFSFGTAATGNPDAFNGYNSNVSTRMAITSGGQTVVNNGTTAFTRGGTARLTVKDSSVAFSYGNSNSDLVYHRRMGNGVYQQQTYYNNNTGEIQLQPYGGAISVGKYTGGSAVPIRGAMTVSRNGGHTSGNITVSHTTLDLFNPLESDTNEKGSILTFSDYYYDSNGKQPTTRAGIKGGTDSAGNSGQGFLEFFTNSSSANALLPRMRIHQNGYIGIATGTTGLARQLEVHGQGTIRLASSSDPGIDFNASDMQIRYRGATDELDVYSYGPTANVVRIRKSDGHTLFTGNGSGNFTNQLNVRMPNLSGGNNGDGLSIQDDGADLRLEIRKGTGGVSADRRIALYEDGGSYPIFLQEEGGNVGIGKFQFTQSNSNGQQSLTPESLLHLMSHGTMGSGTDVMLTLEAYISDYGTTPHKIAIDLKGQDSNNNENFARISQATVNDGDYGENNEATSNLIFGVTQSGTYNERMIITGRGHVGMGTLNPGARLEVYHNSNATNGLIVNNPNTGAASRSNVRLLSDAAQFDIYATSAAYSGVSNWGDAGVLSTSSNASGGLILNAQSSGIKFQYGTSTIAQVTSTDLRSDLFKGMTYPNNSFLDFDDDAGVGGAANGVTLSAIGSMHFIIDSNTNGSDKFYWMSNNVSPGSATQLMDLDESGNLTLIGQLNAATKSFDIEHPTKEGKRLHHGVLEGPEHAVYVRGKTKGSLIQLPDYWTGLVHEDTITVQLTPIGKSSELYVKDISDNKVLVSNDTEYFYFIQAERKDVERFEVEYDS